MFTNKLSFNFVFFIFLDMKLTLSELDILIFLLFYLTLTFLGFFPIIFKKTKTSEDLEFIFAGRKLTLPFFVASLVATWYGNILGIGEFVYRYGVVAWFCFGIVYYISAFFYALLITKKAHLSNASTIAELIAGKFGTKAGIFSAFVQLIISFPAVYILMVATFINLLTGIDLFLSILLGTLLSFIYIGFGGFKSNILTNTFQFFIMYLGFGVFLFFSLNSIQFDIGFLSNLPTSHKKFFGNVSWQFLFSWFFISLQTFVDPSFYQRCISAKSPKIARVGILFSIILWMIFDFMTIFIGLISRAALPDIKPLFAYPYLLEVVVPDVWKGFILVAMLATIISTMDSYIFLSAFIIGNDILGKISGLKKLKVSKRTKLGLILSAIFSITLASLIPSAIDLIYKTSSIAVPALFYPLLLSFSKKDLLSNSQTTFLIASSSILTLFFSIIKEYVSYKSMFTPFQQILVFEPMVFGFLWSTIVFLIMFIYNQKAK